MGSAVLCCAVLCWWGSSPASRAQRHPFLDSLVPASRVRMAEIARGALQCWLKQH